MEGGLGLAREGTMMGEGEKMGVAAMTTPF
jgi:hypothetical protein